MLVQRADGVVAHLGDPAHLQIQQTFLTDQIARGAKEELFTPRHLPPPPLASSHIPRPE